MSLTAVCAALLGLALSGEVKNADKPYAIDTTATTTKVKAGKGGTFVLEIKPAKGYKVSREAPLKISVESQTLKLAKSSLGQGDAQDAKSTSPRFDVKFDAAAAGATQIAAKASFFICNENLCEKKTEQVTVAVNVDP